MVRGGGSEVAVVPPGSVRVTEWFLHPRSFVRKSETASIGVQTQAIIGIFARTDMESDERRRKEGC